MATKTLPYGTTFGYATVIGGPYTTLTDVKAITPPSGERGEVDVTHLTSANFTREFRKSWRTPGEASAMLYFHKAAYATLKTFADNFITYFWKITLPLIDSEATNTTLIFAAEVKNLTIEEITSDGDSVVMMNVAFRTTGDTTFTPGA